MSVNGLSSRLSSPLKLNELARAGGAEARETEDLAVSILSHAYFTILVYTTSIFSSSVSLLVLGRIQLDDNKLTVPYSRARDSYLWQISIAEAF